MVSKAPPRTVGNGAILHCNVRLKLNLASCEIDSLALVSRYLKQMVEEIFSGCL